MKQFVKSISLFVIALIFIFLSACSTNAEPDLEATVSAQSTWIAHLSTQVVDQEQVNHSQWNVISHLSTQMPYALELITPVPPGVTITPTRYVVDGQEVDPITTPTPSPMMDFTYPPEIRTGIEEIDRIIDAVFAPDLAARLELVQYLETPCTTIQEGLGGPPRCNPDEEDGTLVEVFPVAAGEGVYLRTDQVENALDFSVRGLYAVYHVPEDAYTTDIWPAGTFGVVLISEDGGAHAIRLMIEDGLIVRFGVIPGWPPYDELNELADAFILPPMW